MEQYVSLVCNLFVVVVVVVFMKEKFEDTKEVIRSRQSKTDNTLAKRKWKNNNL